MSERPFQRGRFEELPQKPINPHPWFDVPERKLAMSSKPFGEIEIAYRVFGGEEPPSTRGDGRAGGFAGPGPADQPPLLLVHGLMTAGYSWRYVVQEFAKSHRVFVPDLPGSGRSSKPTEKYSGSNYAEFIVELTDALKIRGCDCIGNSLGGYLSMRAVLRDPQLFRALINLHSPGILEPRLRALNLAMKIPGLRNAFAAFVRGRPLRFAHQNVHYYHEKLKSLEEAEVYGEPLSTVEGSRAFANILGEVLAPNELTEFAAALAAKPFPIPLLLLYAREDPMVPAWIGPRLHALVPGAQFQWMENTSHFAHVDTPEAVLTPARAFFADL